MKRMTLTNERIFKGKYGWNTSFSTKLYGSEDEYLNAYVNIKEVQGLDIDKLIEEAGIKDIEKGVVVNMSGFIGAQNRVVGDSKIAYPLLVISELEIVK